MRRPSTQTQLVLQAFLDAPTEETYGYALAKASALPSGVIYPILRRLEDQGLVTSRWEELEGDDDGHDSARRRRRFYRLSAEGHRVAVEVTNEARTSLRKLAPGWST
jgi:PadR family transcriptional regulator PadR